MPLRTHQLFAAMGDGRRLDILLSVLEAGELRPQDLQNELQMGQTAVSRALKQLRDAGLVERGNQRTPFRVCRPRETRMLLRAAALIEHATTANPEAAELAERLRRQDMARGADESAGVGEVGIVERDG